MSTAVLGGEPRQSRRLRVKASEGDRSAVQAWRDGHARTLVGFTRSIAVMETAGQVEDDVAGTLRAMAAQAKGTAAARRLKLAGDAVGGAQAAAEHAKRLRQQARRCAEHADMVALRQALGHAGAPLESALHQRLADIDRRLAELRLARRTPQPADDPAQQVRRDAQRRVREARRHCHDAVAHLVQARQLAAEALYRSAHAHDRAAEANARSAGAGIGDVADHNRMAAFHRAAAEADRQRARMAWIPSAQSLETTDNPAASRTPG